MLDNKAKDLIPNAGLEPTVLEHKGWPGIIQAVTGWVQVLALIALIVESISIYSLYRSTPSDPQRIWYVIAALAFFVIVVFAMVFDRYNERKELAQKEVGIRHALDSFGKLLSERYGVVAKSLHMEVIILDLKGSVKITRAWKGVRVLSDFPIPYLPGKLSTNKPGRITTPARLISYNISTKKELILPPRDIKSDGNRSTFKFWIVGDFSKQDGELDYVYESEASEMFRMTKEEVERAYANDQFPRELMTIEPEIVVEELQIEIVFPQGFVVTPRPGVFYAETEIMHNEQLLNVEFDFNNQRDSFQD